MHLHFRKALDILGKTLPFVVLRLLLYGLILVGTVLWFGGVFLLFENWPFPGPAWLAWVFGGVTYGTVIKLLQRYVLYLLKAAHIAVITRLVLQEDAAGELEDGFDQLRYGKDTVLSRFGQVSVLFLVDRLVNRVLRAFNRTAFRLVAFVPGTQALRGFVQRVLEYSAGHVDEAILSYSIARSPHNPWYGARDGLILYVQSWKTILGTGFVLALISYALVLVVAAPGLLLSLGMAEPMRQIVIGGSFLVGLFVKFALMDPFALTAVIVNFHAAIEGKSVSPEWDRKLEGISKRYREIKDQAASWEPSPGGSGAGPSPVTIT